MCNIKIVDFSSLPKRVPYSNNIITIFIVRYIRIRMLNIFLTSLQLTPNTCIMYVNVIESDAFTDTNSIVIYKLRLRVRIPSMYVQ